MIGTQMLLCYTTPTTNIGGKNPNLHDMLWPRLQAWSAGEPQFHNLPWSDSTQFHNPGHKTLQKGSMVFVIFSGKISSTSVARLASHR